MPLLRSQGNGNVFVQATTPTWASGDLWYDTTNNVLNENVNGTTYQIIQTLPTGLASGDMIYYNGTNFVRLAKGTGTQLLQTGTPPSWVASPAPNLTKQTVSNTANFSTTSTTFVDITGVTVTLANRAAGLASCICVLQNGNNTLNASTFFRIMDNGVEVRQASNDAFVAGDGQVTTMGLVTTLGGQIVKPQARVSSGTGTITGGASGNPAGYIEVLETS